MKKFTVRGVALAVGLTLSVGAMAQAMTKVQYRSGQTDIGTEYKLAKAACASFAGNAKDLCQVQARGKERIARAELNARFAPSEEAGYKVRVARAEADYALSREKCDDLAGNVKDVCTKEARAIAVTAKANALAHMKTAKAHDAAYDQASKAQGVADQKTAQAQNKADELSAQARNDAATEKRAADYAVAREKCDALAGDAKGTCLKEAAARFGKS